MWKVSNHRNDKVLQAFEAGVITPMWSAMFDARTSGKTVVALAKGNHPALSQALELRRQERALSELCEEFVRIDDADFAAEYKCYLDQNASIRAGVLPPPSVVNEIAATIFSKYLYERAFAEAKVWQHLVPSSFTRSSFHDNFRADNPHVPACPYCDLDTINAAANSSIEHFLPRSKFPYLAMNALNLMPSCSACNTSWQGKGAKVIEGVTSPIQTDIGAAIGFDFCASSETVSLAAESNAPAVGKYIKLIGLGPRYAKGNIYQSITETGEALFETFAGTNFSEAKAVEYVAQMRRGAPLTRALSAYVRKFDLYRSGVIGSGR
jgi:hypothetical protein